MEVKGRGEARLQIQVKPFMKLCLVFHITFVCCTLCKLCFGVTLSLTLADILHRVEHIP